MCHSVSVPLMFHQDHDDNQVTWLATTIPMPNVST